MQLVALEVPEQRGSHLVFAHYAAEAIASSLRERGVVAGFCLPDIIRIFPASFNTSHMERPDSMAVLLEMARWAA